MSNRRFALSVSAKLMVVADIQVLSNAACPATRRGSNQRI